MKKPAVTILDKTDICKRIPHSGSMCLIEKVKEWDHNSIVCLSGTHTNHNNPLRIRDRLPLSSLIEYAAQAMAIHGSLINEQSDTPQGGYLAALKNVRFFNVDLSDCKDEMNITANKIYSDGKNMIYEFLVTINDEELVSGRATVFGITELGEFL